MKRFGKLRCRFGRHDPLGGWLAYYIHGEPTGQYASRCKRCKNFTDRNLPRGRVDEEWFPGVVALSSLPPRWLDHHLYEENWPHSVDNQPQ